jgi:NAD(P)H-dependent flavin oxidoreductase YrpB (nitropropane dioxygenase family)
MDVLDRLRLDHPLLQAGMGGGIATPALAGEVSAAGALGTLGLLPPGRLSAAVRQVRERAPGRAVAVNLLMPFVGRAHIDDCVTERVDTAVLFFGCPHGLVARLHETGTFVLAQVGSAAEGRAALAAGVDGLIAQGREAGGHLRGTCSARELLAELTVAASGRPVFVAGGVATADDVRGALAGGAAGAVAGTRFLLTPESGAHPEYQRRLLSATTTVETTLFGFGWPARHRVVPNLATVRWCHADGRPRVAVQLLNRTSWPLTALTSRYALTERIAPRVAQSQRPWLPVFSPAPPLAGMPDHVADVAPLYAGDSVLRMKEVLPAGEVVRQLCANSGGKL